MKFARSGGKDLNTNKGEWDQFSTNEDFYGFTKSWLKECHRILKHNGAIWVAGTYHNIYLTGYLLHKLGYEILNEILWHKSDATPNLSCTRFVADHENFIWARKGKRNTFNYDKMRDGNWPEDILKKPNKQMMSVWSINAPQSWEKIFGKHPTQKPFNLLERIVLASTRENDIILDPFSGSSTTGLASIINKRKFVGIDSEKKYLDLSVKRFKEIKNIKLS